MRAKPKVIATLLVNDRIMRAECSLCHSRLDCEPKGTSEERERKLRAALDQHVAQAHAELLDTMRPHRPHA